MSATCQCDETGDNPKCFAHGDGSQWALRQQANDLLRERDALKAENEALKKELSMTVKNWTDQVKRAEAAAQPAPEKP